MKAIAPHPDCQQLFVSSELGNDTNKGSSDRPLKTIAKAINLTDDNSNTWIRLRAGDVFEESVRLTKSGQSATEPLVITMYGHDLRPCIASGDQTAIHGNNVSHVAIMGLQLYAHTREPTAKHYQLTKGGHGIYWLGHDWNGLVLDNLDISHFRNGITVQNRSAQSKDVTVRQCKVSNCHSHAAHSQGLFAHGIAGLTIHGNTFRNNGWYADRDTGGAAQAKATKFNHNIYIDNERTQDVVVIGNTISDAASHGIQLRPGGTLIGNTFTRNPIHAQLGGGSNYQKHNPDGVHAVVMGNQLYQANDIDSEDIRGIGFLFENIRSSICTQNVIAYNASASRVNTRAIRIGGDCQTQNMTFTDNIVFAHHRGAITACEGLLYESHGNSWFDADVDDDDTLTKDIVDFHKKLRRLGYG